MSLTEKYLWPAEGMPARSVPVKIIKPDNYDATKKYPVIVSIGGNGEKASQPNTLAEIDKSEPSQLQQNAPLQGFVLVMPQLYSGDGFMDWWYIETVLKNLGSVASYDPQRMYLRGLSWGGGCVLYLLAKQPRKVFAAALDCCGVGLDWKDTTLAPAILKFPTPLVFYHGMYDSTVPYADSKTAYDKLMALNPSIKPVAFWPEGVGHPQGWNNPADPTMKVLGGLNEYEYYRLSTLDAPKQLTAFQTPPPTLPPQPINMIAKLTATASGRVITADGTGSAGFGSWDIKVVAKPVGANVEPSGGRWDGGAGVISKTLAVDKDGEYQIVLTVYGAQGTISSDPVKVAVGGAVVVPPTPAKTLLATIKVYTDGTTETTKA